MSQPTCETCGRRHGERVLVATLKPLEFGRPAGEWAWLDPTPPARLKTSGPAWRSGYGPTRSPHGLVPAADVRGPRVWDRAHLTLYEAPATGEGWGSLHACDLCQRYYPELVEEFDYTATRLPEAPPELDLQLPLFTPLTLETPTR